MRVMVGLCTLWVRLPLLAEGVDEGAKLVHGGPGRPDGFTRGYFCKPTVFADVCNRDHVVAREEIFGPVRPKLGWLPWSRY